MESQESAKPLRSKWLRLLLWAALGCAALVLLLAIGLGVLVAPDLFFKVPPPEAVARVALQRQSELDHASAEKPGAPAGQLMTMSPTTSTLTNSASSTQAAPSRSATQPELIPAKPDLPQAVTAKRDELNREFAAVMRELEALEKQAPQLSFQEAGKRLNEMLLKHAQLMRKVHEVWLKAYDGDPRFVNTPLYQEIIKNKRRYSDALMGLWLENMVRHERWRELAQTYEYDQWDTWPQAVYYWRRLGGWEGYKHIIGGSIYVRTRGYRILDPIRIWMPYKQFQLVVSN